MRVREGENISNAGACGSEFLRVCSWPFFAYFLCNSVQVPTVFEVFFVVRGRLLSTGVQSSKVAGFAT